MKTRRPLAPVVPLFLFFAVSFSSPVVAGAIADIAAYCAKTVQRRAIIPYRYYVRDMFSRRELGVEYPAENEEQTISEAISIMSEIQAGVAKEESDKPAQGLHKKTHAIVTGTLELKVDKKIPVPDFADDPFWGKRGSFPVVVRFSSASPRQRPDGSIDFVGMAVRVFLPDGPMDLLMTNKPITTGASILANNRIQKRERPGAGAWATAQFLLKHPITAALLAASRHRVEHLGAESYHSGNAVRIGEKGAMVYYAQSTFYTPHSQFSYADNHLRSGLGSTLSQGTLSFDLFGRVQQDPYLQDIEDGMIEWTNTPYRLGKIVLDKQNIEEDERWTMDDWMAFDPYLMKPLGLGRARSAVYQTIQKNRGGETQWALSSVSPLRLSRGN